MLCFSQSAEANLASASIMPGGEFFVQLSRSNIRYLLELVDRTLALQRQEREGKLDEPIDFDISRH